MASSGYGAPGAAHAGDYAYDYYPSQAYPIDNDDVAAAAAAASSAASTSPAPPYGHAPQLSESFYAEAADALRQPLASSNATRGGAGAAAAAVRTQSPFGDVQAAPAAPAPAPTTAHLPSLMLRSPYDSDVTSSSPLRSVVGGGGGGSTSPYAYDEKVPAAAAAAGYTYGAPAQGATNGGGVAMYAGVAADDDDAASLSPRSSLQYDDKTELDHTPANPFDANGVGVVGAGNPYLTPSQLNEGDEDATLNAGSRYDEEYATAYGVGGGARGYDGLSASEDDDEDGTAFGAAGGGRRRRRKRGDGTLGGGGGDDDGEGYYNDDDLEASGVGGVGRRGGGSGSGGGFDAQPLDTQHFGPAPPKGALLRRHKTKKHVRLTQGNLVLDCPVPTKLVSFLSRRGSDEYESMRYTAATCEPDEFPSANFGLRPVMYNRHTEIFICITLYNEDEVLFTRTLHGVMKNIAHLCSRHKSRTWGPEGWKKVVVAIIADGRKKVHPRVLDCLAALGVYQEGVAKNNVNGKVVRAHIYEYTTQLSIDSNLQFKGAERGLVPMQIIFCLKENNAKKINSHRWFFNAFSPILQPNVCVLVDAGTRPENKSIYYLWKAFDLHSNVAGACGEICADTKGKWGVGRALLNPLVAAQNFEYKISNILDKTTESVFGYITVLPGAFSAYRYIALQNDAVGHGPLASYFKGEKLMGADADVFTSNMYLAEDRILCFELAAKRGEDWVLRYVRRARGVTDVPETLPDLIAQRRRWLNGSFFAAVYSLWHIRQFFATSHTTFRKALFVVESFYLLLNLLFAWFGISFWALFFLILSKSLEAPSFHLGGGIVWFNSLLALVYLGTLISCFVFALGNRPATSKFKFIAVSAVFAVLTVYMLIASILCIIKIVNQRHDAIYAQMCISLLATFGSYLISAIIALDPMFLVTSLPAYILLAPSWINILNTYAFANLHDFTWGNRPTEPEAQDLGTVQSAGKNTVVVDLPTAQQDVDAAYDLALHHLRTRPMIIRGDISHEEKMKLKEDYYKSVRSNVLLVWLLSNAFLAAVILGGDSTSAFDSGAGTTRQKVFMITVLVFMGFLSLVRLILSTFYEVSRWIAG